MRASRSSISRWSSSVSGLSSSSELVFEALEAGFFTLFVDIGLADILAFVDLVEVRLREVGDFECLVDFGGVDGGDTLPINALVFELFEDGLVVF